MALGGGAIAMMLFACIILYGGLLYFMLIAMGRDPIMMLPDPLRGFFMVPWNRYGTVLAVVLILIVPAMTSEGIDEDDGYSGGPSSDEISTWTDHESGYLEEDENETYTLDTGGYVMEAWFNLTWTDESPPGLLQTNQPDEFRLDVYLPNGEMESDDGSNPQGGEGSIVINVVIDGDIGGEWDVVVNMVEAGDNTSIVPGNDDPDDGNDFDLDIWFKYME